jgi:hypothetical protein
VFYALESADWNNHFDRRVDERQIDVVINRLVMIKGNLRAFASGVLLGWWLLRFAAAIRRAAALLAAEHKVLFTGDTSTPDKRREEEQGKKRTGESSAHHLTYRVPPSSF